MVLVNATKYLKKAQREKFGIGAFNVTNLEMVRGVIQGAEKANSPVIIQYAEGHSAYVPLEVIGPIMVREAQRSTVPVIVHFDHGESFNKIVQAMNLGFSSVMIDASKESFDKNVALTKEIIRIARALDVSVEAELGMMNRESGVTNEGSVHYEGLKSSFTDPDSAKDFELLTKVDMLAVAFGTVHGVYTQKPALDIERLKKIDDQTNVPLVMHGGSGLADEEYRQVIEHGICKVNYYSTMAYDVANKVQKILNEKEDQVFVSDIYQWTIDLIAEEVYNRLLLFGSENKK